LKKFEKENDGKQPIDVIQDSGLIESLCEVFEWRNEMFGEATRGALSVMI
jgi:hypothetical protein